MSQCHSTDDDDEKRERAHHITSHQPPCLESSFSSFPSSPIVSYSISRSPLSSFGPLLLLLPHASMNILTIVSYVFSHHSSRSLRTVCIFISIGTRQPGHNLNVNVLNECFACRPVPRCRFSSVRFGEIVLCCYKTELREREGERE